MKKILLALIIAGILLVSLVSAVYLSKLDEFNLDVTAKNLTEKFREKQIATNFYLMGYKDGLRDCQLNSEYAGRS